eukprot:Transcript_4988.p1 GENE.Transcript_4988~~Transcript_4988.p1  ORF type:complete len:524 (-),score=26.68 Transcript_4988:16-1452(-)
MGRTLRLESRVDLPSGSVLQRLRGGAVRPSRDGAEARARLLLLVSNAGFGSYSVFLRALSEVPGAVPLGAVFITFVRYNILFLLATFTRSIRTLQARRQRSDTRPASDVEKGDASHLAAFELAVYSVSSALLSVWGTCRVTAAMSEIFASTDNLFIPILSVLAGMGDFGVRTWLACGLSFGAAITVAIIDSAHGGGGAAVLDLKAAAALVASAVVYAGFRVRTTSHLRTVSATSLNLLRMCWMGAISTAMLLVDVALGGPSRGAFAKIRHIPAAQWALMAGGVCTSGFISASLQFEAMRSLPAAKAQPFAALQPLFAGVFGYMALGEPISMGTSIGGLLMIGAALLGCSDSGDDDGPVAEAGLVEEVLDAPTPEQTASTFPLTSRLELVEGALADEVIHELLEGSNPPARRWNPSAPLPLAGAVALILVLLGKARAKGDPREKRSLGTTSEVPSARGFAEVGAALTPAKPYLQDDAFS